MAVDLTEVAMDVDLGAEVTIIRQTGTYAMGGWQVLSTQQIPAFGVLGIASPETLEMIPEGDRVTGSIEFVTAQPIYETLTSTSGISDKILWNGNTYRVQSVAPWPMNGFYDAILVRMAGS